MHCQKCYVLLHDRLHSSSSRLLPTKTAWPTYYLGKHVQATWWDIDSICIRPSLARIRCASSLWQRKTRPCLLRSGRRHSVAQTRLKQSPRVCPRRTPDKHGYHRSIPSQAGTWTPLLRRMWAPSTPSSHGSTASKVGQGWRRAHARPAEYGGPQGSFAPSNGEVEGPLGSAEQSPHVHTLAPAVRNQPPFALPSNDC